MSALRTALATAAGLAALTVAAPVASAQVPQLSSSELVSAFESYIPPSSSLPSSFGEAEVLLSTEQHHIGDRSYRVALPDGFDPARAYPVIMSFGGWGETAENHASQAQLHNAVGNDAVVVYGQGVDDAWGGAPYAETSRDEDIEYVHDILDDLDERYSIDREQVFASGLSNGGGMAAALACHSPETVAGVVGVAGAYYDPTVTDCAKGQVPTLLIHADDDPVVAYEGGNRHGADFQSVDAVLHTFGERNGCDMTAVTEQDDAVMNSTVHTPADCDVATSVVKVHGGGHDWFQAPSATNLAVNFFFPH